MIKTSTPTFGPGGNSDAFKAAGKKSTVQAPEWIRSIGLDAYEFEAGRGVNASEDVLRAIGAEAQKHGILMSLHAPYFISLSSVEEEKRTNSINYITRSLRASELLGADTIVIHTGSASKITRAEAALIVDNIINGESYLSSTQTVKAVFKDAYDIPAWAESSVETLNTLGILLDDGGNINAKDIMTKAQSAQMLTYMMQVTKK